MYLSVLRNSQQSPLLFHKGSFDYIKWFTQTRSKTYTSVTSNHSCYVEAMSNLHWITTIFIEISWQLHNWGRYLIGECWSCWRAIITKCERTHYTHLLHPPAVKQLIIVTRPASKPVEYTQAQYMHITIKYEISFEI